LRKVDAPLIDDGSFEKAPLNTAFGWRFRDNPDVLLERETGSSCSGSSCLHVHFKGATNVGCDLVHQVVPVKPDTSYCLSFLRRSSNLTTDSGVFLAVKGFNRDKPSVASEPVLGNSPWKEEKIEFTAPAGCEAVVLYVRRNESLKMDNKISGDYWLCSLQLRALGSPAE
jgi:hypothetical protein